MIVECVCGNKYEEGDEKFKPEVSKDEEGEV